MPSVSNNPRAALAHALTNDRNGKVSSSDAKAIVDAAVKEVSTAKDPKAVFEKNKQVIEAATLLAQDSRSASRILSSYNEAGTNAVNVRLQGQTGGSTKLPGAALTTLKSAVEESGGEGDLKVSDVKGDATKGFSFHYAMGNVSGEAFAVKYGAGFVITPVKVTTEDLDKATRAFKAYFNESFVPDMREMGSSSSEIAAARRALVPRYALLPGGSDPEGLTSSYPLVFNFPNESGSDHGFYLGFNPANGENEAYAFN